MAFAAMRAGNMALHMIAGTTTMSLVGPLCARAYPAPRYALLLVCLVASPLVAGALMTANKDMVVLLLSTPFLLLGSLTVIRRQQAMAVALLEAEYLSQQRAVRDALTGLLNRAGLTDVLLDLEMAGKSFVLFYLDLDGFKAVNDTMGHPAGDALLRSVAARLHATTRDSDTIARLGGDEFVIVTPPLGPEESAALANSIIWRIADQEYSVGIAGAARIGVSIGYAFWPEDGPTLDALRKHADLALYDAKKAGKGVHRRFVRPAIAEAKEDLGEPAWRGMAPRDAERRVVQRRTDQIH